MRILHGKQILALLFVLCSLLFVLDGCENPMDDIYKSDDTETPTDGDTPTDGETPADGDTPDNGETPDENITEEEKALLLLQSFDFAAEGLVDGTDSVEAGKIAGRFYIPEDEDAEGEGEAPQITYKLVSGDGSTNNGNFKIYGSDLKIEYNSLVNGEYAIRIKSVDSYYNAVDKSFKFKVTLEPPAMKKAPVLYPNFIGSATSGENKLTVEWDLQRSATSYEVWISKTANSAAAMKQGTYNAITSATIENFPEEATKLPNSTRYWVWVKSVSDKGTSDFSPVATAKTMATIDDFWTDNVIFRWAAVNSEGYDLTASTITYHYSAAGLGYIVDILHHEIFDDPIEVAKHFPPTGKHGENLAGLPAGVFITKFQDGHKQSGATGDYYAVYYYGKGVQSWSNPDIKDSYMINPWAGHCEQQSYEDAYFEFTCANHRKYNAGVAEPYHRYPDYRVNPTTVTLYGKDSGGGDYDYVLTSESAKEDVYIEGDIIDAVRLTYPTLYKRVSKSPITITYYPNTVTCTSTSTPGEYVFKDKEP
jgi:hypothetical protein